MRTLSLVESVRQQVLRVQSEIDTLEASEFPYDHSRFALDDVRRIFEDHATALGSLTEDDSQSVVELLCNAAFKDVRDLLPILGFILRSTNVRNAFEVWGPLWRLSCQVMGTKSKLLLSSEWEYSPYTFVGYEQLPGFVLIGFPATESANPFLLPLAGHELGHSVWGNAKLRSEFSPIMQDHILKAIVTSKWSEFTELFPGYTQQDIQCDSLGWQTWEPASAWAVRQAEESFCDFLGVRLFGEAFLHSSAYLLAPSRKGPRSYEYPNKRDRASALVAAAGRDGLAVPDGFGTMFHDLDEPPAEYERTRLLLALADSARRSILLQLEAKAESITGSAGVPKRDPGKIGECLASFRLMIPAEQSGGLANILNAGWEALLAPGFFTDVLQEKHKADYLSELILKSAEILEVESRLAEVLC